MSFLQAGYESVPGQVDSFESLEVDLIWRGNTVLNIMDGGYLLSTATDAGHTDNTTRLRPGLLLGQIISSGKWTNWSPTATDGSERICGILGRMKYLDENKWCGNIITGGYIKNDNIIVPGQTSAGLVGQDLEFIVRDLMAERFILDDRRNSLVPRQVVITADTTIDGTFHNSIISNDGDTGTAIVTLPAPKKGFRLTLHQVSNQILRISTPSANQLKLMDGTTAQTLDLAAATNKIMLVRGISTTLYQAVVIPTTDT